jgi:hypothetical protein
MEKVINIEYSGSVNTPAGWRSVSYKGMAERISEKRCRVIEITEIDGESVKYNMSRTGAKRQQYNGVYFADAEKGKIKNISSLHVC